MRELSAKMPAKVDATLPARDPATRPSDTQKTGDGGSNDAAPSACSQTTSQGAKWENLNDNKPGWEAKDGEFTQKDDWQMRDRKDENDEGGMPQRDPDNDGDLN